MALDIARLAGCAEFTVAMVTCNDDHTGWSVAELRDDMRVVLARRGRFRRLAGGVTADIDTTVGYLGVPGEEERFAHPAGGDACTWLSLRPDHWPELADADPPGGPFYVDARLDLAHRRLLSAAASGDAGYAAAEALTRLLGLAIGWPGAPADRPGLARQPRGPSQAAGAGRRGPMSDRALVDRAREAIAAGHPEGNGLLPLARLLGTSPYRLSRAFTRELGVSLTRYRNRVRVGAALDRLAGGEQRLAELAADLGFADQAHLTRTVRQHVGYPPAAVRRLLSS
jgi:AraC-like DNA-binding protein